MFDLTVRHPNIETRMDHDMKVTMTLTREELLAEVVAVGRVLLGTATNDDLALAEGADSIH